MSDDLAVHEPDFVAIDPEPEASDIVEWADPRVLEEPIDPDWKPGMPLGYVRPDPIMLERARREGTWAIGAVSIVVGGITFGVSLLLAIAAVGDDLDFEGGAIVLFPLLILTTVFSAIGKSIPRSRALSVRGRLIGFAGPVVLILCLVFMNWSWAWVSVLWAGLFVFPMGWMVVFLVDEIFARDKT